MNVHEQADQLTDHARARLEAFDSFWQLALATIEDSPQLQQQRDEARASLSASLKQPFVSHVAEGIRALKLPGADAAEQHAAAWVDSAWDDAQQLRELIRNALQAS